MDKSVSLNRWVLSKVLVGVGWIGQISVESDRIGRECLEKQAGLVKSVHGSRWDWLKVSKGSNSIKMGQECLWKQAKSKVSGVRGFWESRQDWSRVSERTDGTKPVQEYL